MFIVYPYTSRLWNILKVEQILNYMIVVYLTHKINIESALQHLR